MSLFEQERERYPEGLSEKTIQQYKKFAETYPPYNFVIYYVNIMSTISDKTQEGEFAKLFAKILGIESSKDINQELRLIELEKDLIPLVESTGNKVFFRPLFFPSIFINNDFHFEDLIIKGIYITECHTEKGSTSYCLHHPNVNDYAVFAVAADVNIGCEYYLSIALVDKAIGTQFLDSKAENNKLKRCAEYLRMLICNVIDMVEGNTDDLSVVTIETTRERDIKRMKRKQVPMPTRIIIRAKDKIKRYIRKFNSDAQEAAESTRGGRIGHKSLVIGHYRHFRNEKFKKVKGTKKWIFPYWKGEGIAISKEYFLRKSEEKDSNIGEEKKI
jgi:hypothetical protein